MSRMKPLPDVINGFRVIEDLGTILKSGRKRRLATFQCKSCGEHFKNLVEVVDRPRTKGCGCLMPYNHRAKQVKTNTPKRLRSIYAGMKGRCNDVSHMNYKSYGNLGIKICDEWLETSSDFYTWALSNGYKDNLTIDRINPKEGYHPGNCQFITMQENIQKRTSITKLNPEKVRAIRRDFDSMTTREVGKKWGLSHHHIIDIKLKRAWSNV